VRPLCGIRRRGHVVSRRGGTARRRTGRDAPPVSRPRAPAAACAGRCHARWGARERAGQQRHNRERTESATAAPAAVPSEVPSPRHVATLLVQRPERRSAGAPTIVPTWAASARRHRASRPPTRCVTASPHPTTPRH